ncbi:hypothetical protein [Lentzea sp. NPDC092896]|uniref:hypothetical protein n=1 Tax=Lentzea sp. NPDC092896 TaxID=3364127 RepID=UPI00380C0FB0
MTDWSRSDLIATFSSIAAVIAIIVTIIVTRRWGTRRAKLLFQYKFTSLLPVENDRYNLKVVYKEQSIDNPHLVTLRLANVGPKDVSSGNFDAGQSIRIDFECPIYGSLGWNGHKNIFKVYGVGSVSAHLRDTVSCVEIAPTLLKVGETWEVELLVSGDRDPNAEFPLIDTDIINQDAKEKLDKMVSEMPKILPTFGLSGLFMPFLEPVMRAVILRRRKK